MQPRQSKIKDAQESFAFTDSMILSPSLQFVAGKCLKLPNVRVIKPSGLP